MRYKYISLPLPYLFAYLFKVQRMLAASLGAVQVMCASILQHKDPPKAGILWPQIWFINDYGTCPYTSGMEICSLCPPAMKTTGKQHAAEQ